MIFYWTVLNRNDKPQCLDKWDCRQTSAGYLLNTMQLACYDLFWGLMTFVEGRIFVNAAGKVKTPHKWQYLPV